MGGARPLGPTGEETESEQDDGVRNDQPGTATSEVGATPNVGSADPGARMTPSDPNLPSGNATGAGGGYGTGSANRSSGGTGDGEVNAGDDPETDWLRDAPGGSS